MPPKKATLQFKSPAEFFANNKGIAGFDNPGKSLYTSVRELVENSLDAAESVGTLPEIQIEIEEVDLKSFNKSVGITKADRKNESIYKSDEPEKKNEKVKKKKAMYYKLSVRDNGSGMPHDEIPNMFGRVLAGTKYCVRQNRGRFGLGAKMVLIWSKMSTAQPICIKSAQGKDKLVTDCVLDMDIYKNVPRIIKHDKIENKEKWTGSEISVVIEGNWVNYRSKILSYMRQLAVITPYADFTFSFSNQNDVKKGFAVKYARRTDFMPEIPQEIKHHPSSVNLIVLKQLFSQVPKQTLKRALTSQFSSINNALATKIVHELGIDDKKKVETLEQKQYIRIRDLFKELKFPDPPSWCLSPAGEYNLRLGIMKELKPDFVATASESPDVIEGHPFVVEAGVSLGGKGVQPGMNIYRFANRIPLLFEPGSDVVKVVATSQIKWAQYKINPNNDKIGVFVSIVSTKIPFKGTGKEYIGDDDGKLSAAVKKAIQQCLAQLRSKISRMHAAKDRQNRKKQLVEYIPPVSKSLISLISKIDPLTPALADDESRNFKSAVACVQCSDGARKEFKPEDVITDVAKGDLNEFSLKRKLEAYIFKMDAASSFSEAEDRELQNKRMKLNLVYFDKEQPMFKVQHPDGAMYFPEWLLL